MGTRASSQNRPDFIIIGAQKCGTSTLYRTLLQHPQVRGAVNKELHFFDRNYQKGYNWYLEQFPLLRQDRRNSKLITGEATPSYIFHPLAAKRIKHHLPDVKLIVLLRNPVDRALSHYHHQVRKKRESLSFKGALSAEPFRLCSDRINIRLNENHPCLALSRYSYKARGLYSRQLRAWFALFKREQFHFIKSENLFSEPKDELKALTDFLAIDPFEDFALTHHNRGQYQVETTDQEDRNRLKPYFIRSNRWLQQNLGQQFHWY